MKAHCWKHVWFIPGCWRCKAVNGPGAADETAKDDTMLEATSEYLRDALERIAWAMGLAIGAEYGPKPNGILLDDILLECQRLGLRKKFDPEHNDGST